MKHEGNQKICDSEQKATISFMRHRQCGSLDILYTAYVLSKISLQLYNREADTVLWESFLMDLQHTVNATYLHSQVPYVSVDIKGKAGQ